MRALKTAARANAWKYEGFLLSHAHIFGWVVKCFSCFSKKGVIKPTKTGSEEDLLPV